MPRQLSLFNIEEPAPRKKKRGGGSMNPIVFHDYESFLAKFADNPKTTDDCYTPPDVYEAVVRYVGTAVDLTGKKILRPFYPGGDYENAEYPEDGVVIDNPPFSIFARCCKFYAERRIPFFLFGPGMTIFTAVKWCTAVIIGVQIIFENGAAVRCNFASNLFGDLAAVTAPELTEWIKECPSQNRKAMLPKYEYPSEVLSVSAMQTMANGGVGFAVERSQCVNIKHLDLHPKGNGGLFGDHLLLSAARARAAEAARARAAEAARAPIKISLSEREKRMIKRLNTNS